MASVSHFEAFSRSSRRRARRDGARRSARLLRPSRPTPRSTPCRRPAACSPRWRPSPRRRGRGRPGGHPLGGAQRPRPGGDGRKRRALAPRVPLRGDARLVLKTPGRERIARARRRPRARRSAGTTTRTRTAASPRPRASSSRAETTPRQPQDPRGDARSGGVPPLSTLRGEPHARRRPTPGAPPRGARARGNRLRGARRASTAAARCASRASRRTISGRDPGRLVRRRRFPRRQSAGCSRGLPIRDQGGVLAQARIRAIRAGDLEEALGFDEGIERRAEPGGARRREGRARAKLAADRGAASAREFAAMEAEARARAPTKPVGFFQSDDDQGVGGGRDPGAGVAGDARGARVRRDSPPREGPRGYPPERAAAERGGVATEAMLETTGYAYVPNDALKRSTTSPRRRVGAPLRNRPGRGGVRTFRTPSLGSRRALGGREDARGRGGGDDRSRGRKVEVGSPAPARVVVVGVSPGRATATATPRVRHIACADTTPARAERPPPPALSVMTRELRRRHRVRLPRGEGSRGDALRREASGG